MKPPFPEGTVSTFAPNTPHFFLSNFYPQSITYDGITYPSSEHAYQAAKTLDESVRMMIMRCGPAAAAKKLGASISLRSDWDQVKLDIMNELLMAKFAPGTDLEKKLQETGDGHIIEGNYWHDRYWGQCFCLRHNWEGRNHLGSLLMEIRADIRR